MDANELRAAVADRAFGHRLVSNVYRGLVAEVIVGHWLGPMWNWCGGDWSGWDFEHRTRGIRLEVKQTAEVQTWTRTKETPAKRVYGIAPGKGFFTGDQWTPLIGRRADMYVFAYHGHNIRESADHFDVTQWSFLALTTLALPATRTISLDRLRMIAAKNNPPTRFAAIGELGQMVEEAIGQLAPKATC